MLRANLGQCIYTHLSFPSILYAIIVHSFRSRYVSFLELPLEGYHLTGKDAMLAIL